MTLGATDELCSLLHASARRPGTYKSMVRPAFSLDNVALTALLEPLLLSNRRGFTVRLGVGLALLVAVGWLMLRLLMALF